MNAKTLELDLSKDGLGGNVVRIGQGDKYGTTIKAYIYDSGADVSLSGYTVYLEVLLPNKRNYYRAAASVSGNVATVNVDESKLASVSGYTDEAYFTIEKAAVKYSTERFAIEVLRNARDGQQPAQSWDDAVSNLISSGSAAVAAANTAATAANKAASSANGAASSANAAASGANAAATSASSAATAASSAATSASDAATSANTAATSATKAATAANGATTNANTAASTANAAGNRANGAADDATAAAQNALNIANAIASIKPPSDSEVEELRTADAVIAAAVAGLLDGYLIIGETVYAAASRVPSISGETATLSHAGISGETATLN